MKKLIIFLLALTIGCSGAQALPEGEWAVVNTSSVFMRETASYTSQNVSQSRMGTPVRVLGRSGYWVKILTPEPYEGWVNELTLAPYPADYRSCRRYICIKEHGYVYSKPSVEAPRLCDFLMSDIVRKGDSPSPSEGSDGWVSVQLWDGRSGWVPAADVQDFRQWMSERGSLAAKAARKGSAGSGMAESEIAETLVATARLFLGNPYMWGGMSSGLFDCSGLTGFCYFMSGIQLPRDASQQIKCGVPVEFEDMQAGDLVFFGNTSVGHVALCTGQGRIIHSSQIVRENSLIEGEPDYYKRNILGIRRILGNTSGKQLIKNSSLYFEK